LPLVPITEKSRARVREVLAELGALESASAARWRLTCVRENARLKRR